MIELAVLILSSILNVMLGLVVYIKNPKSITNRLFLVLATSFTMWSIVNYFSVHPAYFSQIVWVRLVLFFAAFLCLSMYLTFTVFPETRHITKSKHWTLAIVATLIVMALTQTSFVFKLDAKGDPSPNFAIPLFAILVVVLLGNGITRLIMKYHKAKGREKDQLRLVLVGIAGTFGLILLANFLLVVLFQYTALIPFGPAFTLIFIGSMAYAIVKHRLFDIRAATARVLAYLLSFLSVGLVYGLLVFGLSGVFNQQARLTNVQRGFYISFALITALIFPKTKNFFDRITNRFFFQDAYDPQNLIDNLNSVLARNIELDKLLKDSEQVLLDNLKCEFVVFRINETTYSPMRMIGKNKNGINNDEIAILCDRLVHHRTKVTLTDYLQKDDEVRELLIKNDVAALATLSAPVHQKTSPIGYVLFGSKKSGNTYSSTDIRMLEIIANELVIAVQNALRFEEIQNFNITLQEKVDEATKQLRRTNEKLRQLDETKDDFISMASHQLRTPLTSVKGYVSMVLDGDVGKVSVQQKKLLEQAYVSSQRMVYLIADLLNVSRLKTGKFIITPTPTNLADLVEGEIAQLKDTASARGLELLFDKPKEFPMLMLDETKIRQVVMNFSDNAIYYTPTGGHIKIELHETPSMVEFTVNDDGIGVPKSEQHHLFSKFYRAGNAKKARPDGTGLGLFMAKKVIVASGGALIFHSQEGNGSTFGFSFPKDKLKVPSTTSKTPAS